jgi:cytidine deaminase
MMNPDKKLHEVIQAAINEREKAKTFHTKVGVAFEMFDGVVIPGFNIETYAQKAYHAEEVGVIVALAQGYNGTDFRRMVEVYQDASYEDIESFPACPYCWAMLNELTHPYLEIIVADAGGKVRDKKRLKDILKLEPPSLVYPSNKMREAKPRMNMRPKLPLNEELKEFYEKDPQFRGFCDNIFQVRV